MLRWLSQLGLGGKDKYYLVAKSTRYLFILLHFISSVKCLIKEFSVSIPPVCISQEQAESINISLPVSHQWPLFLKYN